MIHPCGSKNGRRAANMSVLCSGILSFTEIQSLILSIYFSKDVFVHASLAGFRVFHSALKAHALTIGAIRPRFVDLAAQFTAAIFFCGNISFSAHPYTSSKLNYYPKAWNWKNIKSTLTSVPKYAYPEVVPCEN
jgi:hypothetical protein